MITVPKYWLKALAVIVAGLFGILAPSAWAASVTDVNSSTSNGTYTNGDSISIQITFSELVNVDTAGGVPSVAFNSGGEAVYSSGTGSSTLTFTYSVGVTDNSSDLNCAIFGQIQLNSGTIKDGATIDASLVLPTTYGAGSLAVNKDLVIVNVPAVSATAAWSKRLGGAGADEGLELARDFNDNLYVVGTVTGDADLNSDGDSSDGGAEDATGYGLEDIVVSSFDSSGAYRWSKRLGGTLRDRGYDVATDANGNIFITGDIIGDVDLNGDGDATDGGAESAAGYGGEDIFLTSFDSSGNHRWARRLGSGSSGEQGWAVATDAIGNIVVVGQIWSNADLNGDGDSSDGGAESGANSNDAFISVFDSSGTHLWAKRIAGTGNDDAFEVNTALNRDIVVVGFTQTDCDLNGDGDSTDGGAESGSGYGGFDGYVTVFDYTGAHLWAKRFGASLSDKAHASAIDNRGNVFITGYVAGNADLNGDGDSTDGGAEDATGFGNRDIFVTAFDSSGSHLWAKRLGGLGHD